MFSVASIVDTFHDKPDSYDETHIAGTQRGREALYMARRLCLKMESQFGERDVHEPNQTARNFKLFRSLFLDKCFTIIAFKGEHTSQPIFKA